MFEQSFGAMEVGSLSSAAVALEKMMVYCAMEAVVLETLVAAGRSLASILMIVWIFYPLFFMIFLFLCLAKL